jgi:hypothetical protein
LKERRLVMSSNRDPRTDPQTGDMLRKETQDYSIRIEVLEVIGRDQYGVRFSKNGTIQGSVSLESWKNGTRDHEIIYKGI